MAPSHKSTSIWTRANDIERNGWKMWWFFSLSLSVCVCVSISIQNRNINIIYRNWQSKYFTFWCGIVFYIILMVLGAHASTLWQHNRRSANKSYAKEEKKIDLAHVLTKRSYVMQYSSHVTYSIAHTLITNDLIHFYDVRNKMQCNIISSTKAIE